MEQALGLVSDPARVEAIARAIYEVNPALAFISPAGDWSLYAATDEHRPVPWEKVRDEQWAIYFGPVDQALAAIEAAY